MRLITRAAYEALTHGPANDAPAVAIQDGDEVQPALSRGSAVASLTQTWLERRRSLVPSVRSDGFVVAAVGASHSIFGALPGAEPL